MLNSILSITINDYYVATFFWNIFLALIPCYMAYRLSKKYYLKKWSNISTYNQLIFIIIFLLWLFFLPNTAYLLTDVRHLANYCDNLDPSLRVCKQQAWIVPLFFTYAAIGIPTFYYALNRMTFVIGKMFGKFFRIIFPIVLIPLSSLGLMLGLVGRFNSWNVIYDPLSVARVAFSYFSDSAMLLNWFAYTLMLFFIYYFILELRTKD